MYHPAVIRPERARRAGDRASDGSLEDLSGLDQLLAQRKLIEPPPWAMAHPVAADLHPCRGKRPQPVDIEKARRSEPAGDDEERRGQLSCEQRGKRALQVGHVAIVEGNRDVLASGDAIKHRQELSVAHPDVLFTRIEAAFRLAYAVESEVDGATRHQRINEDPAGSLAWRANLRRILVPEEAREPRRLFDDRAGTRVPPG